VLSLGEKGLSTRYRNGDLVVCKYVWREPVVTDGVEKFCKFPVVT
jgi:hypothetical protein